jgi:Tol biopolymer transport system component
MRRAFVVLFVLSLGALGLVAGASGTTTIRVSLAWDGAEVAKQSYQVAISADGSTVAFVSKAGRLVEGDTNRALDVFVYDVASGLTARASVRSNGTEGNGDSGGDFDAPALSADGRFVAFTSAASNLVKGDRNGTEDVFVHDMQTGATTRVSVRSNGAEANGASWSPAISGDGARVVFVSSASNLVPREGNDLNDVFVRDRSSGRTRIVSVASDRTGANGMSANPAISGDGRTISFDSWATNLVRRDTNDAQDVFVHRLRTHRTRLVSVRSDGTQATGCDVIVPGQPATCSTGSAITADGRFVAFASSATNLVRHDTNGVPDVFVHDVLRHRTTRASLTDDDDQARRYGAGSSVDISADGRSVAFTTFAKLVPEDTNRESDAYVRDRDAATTTRVSVTWEGGQADNGSGAVAMSDDGAWAAFVSGATNLTADADTNDQVDVYLRGPLM